METFVALLRAVNVGGTGKLPMSELKLMCKSLGFVNVQTYIASGNVVFNTDLDDEKLKSVLEAKLAEYAGKAVGAHVRSAAELKAVLEANPFLVRRAIAA